MKAPLTYRCPSCDHEVTVGQCCNTCAIKEKSRRRRSSSAIKEKKRAPWEQDHQYDGLDLPDDSDEFVNDTSIRNRTRLRWYWILTALLLLLATIMGLLK